MKLSSQVLETTEMQGTVLSLWWLAFFVFALAHFRIRLNSLPRSSVEAKRLLLSL